ncbi:MAG: efflux RND transporter periplasmic adaptor subunit [Alphaproteobacteria bacterium]
MWRHKWWTIIIIVVVVLGFIFLGGAKKSGTRGAFVTVDVSRGDMEQVVSATGEISPVNTVSVGSQVSGTIEDIFVDFNSRVKQGDILLKIEPSVLQSSVTEAHAALDSAKSQMNLAKSDYVRNKSLYADGFIARAEMEQSQSQYEQSVAAVTRAQSQYDKAVTNLGYATITSPVDGTVISRKVDKGQTVAASFQTPDLFEIAEDLTKMQIETAVSEADIGMIQQGQSVHFTVDAYPGNTFVGVVRQIRLSPTTTSNVVVYTVVIDVDNEQLLLMPGMTAFVTIVVNRAEDAWYAPNSAFLVKSFENIDPAAANVSPENHLAVLRDKQVVIIPFEKGLVTATETQIVSDEIQFGDKIIVGRVGQVSSGKKSTMRSRPMGGGPM